MRRCRSVVVFCGVLAAGVLAHAQTSLTLNGVACDKAEMVQGLTACLVAATLDGQPFPFRFGPSGAAIDLDQDAAYDLILSSNFSTQNTTPSPVSFFKGAGNGKAFFSFTPAITGAGNQASALFTRNIVVGDFNGDGKQDFYLADATEYASTPGGSFTGTSQYLYLASGAGRYTKVNAGVGIKTVHGPAAGTPSSDGFALVLNTPWQPLDSSPSWVNFVSVSAAGAATNRSVLYSDPLFAPLSPSNGGFPYLTAIDVNGDGARDIVMLGRYGNNNNVVWLNDGHGSFTLGRTLANWSNGLYQAENAEVADLNGDGLQDMIVMHIDRRTTPQTTNVTLRVWINDGRGGFTDQTATWLGTNYQDYTGGYFDFKIVDVDGDGFPDVVFTTQPRRMLADGTAPAKVVVLRNRGGRGFDVVEFETLKWTERFAGDQWMPGSVVVYPVNGKPTVMFSQNGQVYNVRFASAPRQSDCLFNWAERSYPQLFPAPATNAGNFAQYYYRQYTASQTYLATSIADSHVWLMGPITGNVPVDVGAVANFLAPAGCTP